MSVFAPASGVTRNPSDQLASSTLRQPAELCPDPLFILGAPRSGTSILVWALAQHPRLWGSAESNVLHHLFGDGHVESTFEALGEQHGSSWLRHEGIGRREWLRHLGLGVNSLFSSRSGGRRWIDKSIPNTLMADIIGEMFPGASFLHILRDGRQVVHSMVNARFPDPTVSEFPVACRTWRTFVELADEFCALHPHRCLTVFYERLVQAPEQEFQRIFRFLEIERDPGSAAFLRSHRINSSFGPEQPDQDAAGHRVGSADGWRTWTEEQRRVFWREAAPTLREFCRVPAEELEALRPRGAAPLPAWSPAAPHQRTSDRSLATPPSASHSLQAQLRERTRWAQELSSVLAKRDATIAELLAAHDAQAERARHFEARLARLESSMPLRLYRRARSSLPRFLGGYSVSA